MTRDYKYGEQLMSIENLGLTYGKTTVLRDVSLTIDNVIRPGMNQGQTIALLGPSGIGKTQLFRCIAGFNPPTTGAVRLKGSDHVVRAGEVGVVQQAYPLLNHRTVLGNLRFVSKDEKRITELLERFGLAAHAKSYPTQLSGGQRQRVAILQQLLRNNHFILMDEPFSGLDIIAKEKVCDLIREVSLIDELNTTIFTTHDIESAVSIADTVWVLGREPEKAGATILHKIDLIQAGLAWVPNVEEHPAFHPMVQQIKTLFKTL